MPTMVLQPSSGGTPGAKHIKTKKDFYRLYQPYRLGNSIRQYAWDQWLQLYLSDEVPKDVFGWAVRVKIPDNPYMRYEMTAQECHDYAFDLIEMSGLTSTDIQVSELAPDHKLILQGHVQRGTAFVHGEFVDTFFADPAKNRMRASMDRFRSMRGLAYWQKLRQAMDEPSFDQLREIWDEYPDSIVEYAVYSIPVGIMGINTIIWEVRDY